MRMLFTCVPGVGHLLPLLPLARAAATAGHEITVSTHQELAELAPDFPFAAVGPSGAELMAENVNRHRGKDADPVTMVADLFTATRVQLTYEAALAVAERVRPGLIVADSTDFVAPLVAAQLGVPWVAHAVTAPPPPALARGFAEGSASCHRQRRLTPRPRLGLVDIWPSWLTAGEASVPGDRWPMRPGEEMSSELAAEPRQPTVLVTLGTVLQDDGLVSAAVDAVVDLGLNAVVTIDPATAGLARWPSDRVRAVGFVPLAQLLPDVDSVITAGGAGTVLATLRHALPMVLAPRQADQPQVSARIEAFGAGIVCARDDQVRAALAQLRREPGYRSAAHLAADRLERLDPASRVWSRIAATLAAAQLGARQ